MKKDIEWLRQNLNTEKYYRETNELKDKTTYGELYDRGVRDGINVALELVDLLDEPEVLSQRWIDEHEQCITGIGTHKDGVTQYHYTPFVSVHDLQNTLVIKQEKPVIPQFVADYIRATKPSNSLRLAFKYIAQRKIDNYDDELALWVEEGNSELFAKAWLDGYEVEKEKKYRVVFRSHKDDLILFKTGEHIFIGAESANNGCWKQHFTEAEIKAIDKRFWAFAEEVTE